MPNRSYRSAVHPEAHIGRPVAVEFIGSLAEYNSIRAGYAT